jgi:hypothetical protein
MKYHALKIKALFGALAMALVAAVQLNAQDFPKYSGGLHFGFAVTTGDLADGSSAGFNGGIYLERNWALSFANRIRLEGTGFWEKADESNNSSNKETKTVATAFNLALDFVLRTPTGLYFFVAPTYMSLSLRNPAFSDEKGTSPGVSGGIGWLYARNSVNGRTTGGVEAKYTQARGFKYRENDFDFSWVTISLVFRF